MKLAHALWWLMLVSMSSHAAVCTPDDSVNTCRTKLIDARQTADVQAADSAESAARSTLAKINTGPSAAVASVATSAFTDFFSLLNVAAQDDQAGGEDDEALGFELNRCTPGMSDTGPLQCQVRVRLGESTLFDPLKNALPAATRAERTAELEEGLDQTDNVTAGVFLNLVSENYGRVPDFRQGSIYAAVRQQVNAEMQPKRAAAAKASFEWLRFLESLPESFDAGNPDIPFSAYPAGRQEEALEVYERTIAPRIDAAVDTQALLQEYGYFDLIDLVNNQPQINGGVEFNLRGELVGPDEIRAKISYEMGPVSMKDLRSYIRERGGECAAVRPPGEAEGWRGPAGCAADFLHRPDVMRSLRSSARLTFTAEYVRRKHYALTLPEDGVAIDLPSVHSLIGSLVWGGYIPFVSADMRATRFDLAASYEDVSSDPLRQDRGLANLTLSHSLMNGLIASVSLVYATKAEFRGEVDKEWSSRLGFNYKFGLPGDSAK